MVLIVPIGHDDSKMHRIPFVSLGIILACVLAFAFTWPRFEGQLYRLKIAAERVVTELRALAGSEHDVDGEFSDVLRDVTRARGGIEAIEIVEHAVARWESRDLDPAITTRLKEAVQAVQKVRTNNVLARFGLVPSSIQPHALLTHMFLHAGLLHLIFNLAYFILFGPSLEDRWGRSLFALVYLLSGLAGVAGHMLAAGDSVVPMIGASAAIAGLAGAFLVAFTDTRIDVLFVWFYPRVYTVRTPVLILIWMAGEVAAGVAHVGTLGGSGVAHWAHVGGFVFGFCFAIAMRYTGLDEKLASSLTDTGGASLPHASDPGYATAARLRDAGDWQGARAALESLAGNHPASLEAWLELTEACRRTGDTARRETALLRAAEIAAHDNDPRLSEIIDTIRREFPNTPVPAACRLQIAVVLERRGQLTEAIECLRELLAQPCEDSVRARAAIQLTGILIVTVREPTMARVVLIEARDAIADPAWRDRLERRLQNLDRAAKRSQA